MALTMCTSNMASVVLVVCHCMLCGTDLCDRQAMRAHRLNKVPTKSINNEQFHKYMDSIEKHTAHIWARLCLYLCCAWYRSKWNIFLNHTKFIFLFFSKLLMSFILFLFLFFFFLLLLLRIDLMSVSSLHSQMWWGVGKNNEIGKNIQKL